MTKRNRPAPALSRENPDPALEHELAGDQVADQAAAAEQPELQTLSILHPEQGCTCRHNAGNDVIPLCECCASMPAHRRCPRCWGGNRGVGVAYSTQAPKTYYRCDHSLKTGGGRCNATWSATVKLDSQTIRVEHRRVDLETR